MTDRIFTLAEAQAALAELRPVAERMVELRVRQRAAGARRVELQAAIGSNGHGLTLNDLALVDCEIRELGREIDACVIEIHETGALVKDLEIGTLDFATRRDGRDVYLCWRVGEDAIRHWHGLDEGFAGRKPLGEDE